MFVTHLKKELRQSAPTLAALAFLVLVAAPGFTAVYFLLLHPDWSFDAADFAWRIAAVAAAAALLALGDAAVPESREGNAALLARLPGALGPSFLARSIVLVVGTVLTTALAFAVTAGACAAIGERLWFGTTWAGLLAGGGRVVGMAALGALWTLALVSGVRRGGLAFPAAALVAGFAVVPTWWALRAAGVWPKSGDVPFAIGLLAVAAALAAWIAFRGSFRWSRGPTAGAWRGVAALLVLTAPIPALGALRHHQWTTVEPDEDLRIFFALAGAGGRRLYLSADRPWSGAWTQPLSLVADLERATLERIDGMILPGGHALGGFGFHRRPQPIVLHVLSRDDWCFVDTVTGETIHRSPGKIVWTGLPAAFKARLADTLRRSAPIALPDGRPAWTVAGEILTLEPDGSIGKVLPPDGFVPRSGAGPWVSSFDRRELDLRSMRITEPRVGPRTVAATSEDGTLWFCGGDEEAGFEYVWKSRLDGEERTLTGPLLRNADGDASRLSSTGLYARDGRLVLTALSRAQRPSRSVLLDPRDASLSQIPGGALAFAIDEDGSVLARTRDGRSIVRFDPDTEAVEVLFPPGP
ncbi:MAG: hypothetical protein ACF8XB_17660 [Planctomycetota bacterium JB042]